MPINISDDNINYKITNSLFYSHLENDGRSSSALVEKIQHANSPTDILILGIREVIYNIDATLQSISHDLEDIHSGRTTKIRYAAEFICYQRDLLYATIEMATIMASTEGKNL